ncbi:hypothetical protein [Streptomyces hilarionis]|uniref:hypothetical protein n=1 Tax=Streptomyces hilarionis TaxID=2839954 RepID=UPI003F683D37
MSKPRQRTGLYRTVLHEGLRDDLPHYLNQDLLLQLWPVLCKLVGRTVRTVWEDASRADSRTSFVSCCNSPPAPVSARPSARARSVSRRIS